MPPFFILFSGFSLAVTAVWLRHHFFALPVDWLAISLPLIVSAFIFVPFVLWRAFQKEPTPLRLHRFVLPAGAVLVSIAIFNAQAFLIGLLPGHAPVIPLATWFAANTSFLTKLGTVIATYFLLTGVLAATGNSVLKRLRDPDRTDASYGFFLRIVIGSSLWATLLVALGWLSALTPGVIWVCLAGIALFEWRYLLSLCRYCLGSDVWHLDVKSPLFALALFGLFLVALNLSETIRPEPTGFDDMTYYMDHVHRMQASQTFIAGGHPFPFELLAAAVGIASHDQTMMLALSLGVYGLLIGAAILFAFGRAVWGVHVGAIAAVLTLSIPMGAALALNETKPDAWLFLVTTLFFWSLIRWLRSRDMAACFLALYLFSFALTIKLTALFLIGPFGLAIGSVLSTQRPLHLSWRAALRQSLITAAFFLLPLLPWLVLAEVTHPPTRPYQVNELLLSFAPLQPSLAQDIEYLLTDTHCQATGVAEDLARFRNHRGALAAAFFLPWDITMNLTVAAFATEIGFLFLAVLPLWLWYGVRAFPHLPRLRLQSPVVQFTFFLLGYGLLWILFAKRVPWYGYPAIALAALLTASLIDRSRSFSPYLSRYLMVLLVLSVIGNTLVRLNFTGTREHLRYAGGTLSAEDYLDTTFPGLKTLRSAINRPSLPRVYITGSRLLYAFDDHTQRTFNDPHLDTFNCLFDASGSDGVLETFHALDIQYVFFSRILLRELQHDQNQTFRTKIERFTDFTGHQLRVVWGSADYMLFEVPRAPFVPADTQ
ncbi:MAG: hypothetical protein WAT84_02425 [Candidatus Moraniibacteriota bacterium]